MTEEEIREMARSNYAAQLAGLGYGPDGMALPPKDSGATPLKSDEVKSHAGNGLKDGCFWIETRYGGLAPAFLDLCVQGELRVYSPFLHPASNPDSNMTWWPLECYGDTWRVWAARPSEEERTTGKWN